MMCATVAILRRQRIERERRAYLDGLQQQCVSLIAKAKRRNDGQLVRLLEHILGMLGGAQ